MKNPCHFFLKDQIMKDLYGEAECKTKQRELRCEMHHAVERARLRNRSIRKKEQKEVIGIHQTMPMPREVGFY